MDICLNCKKEIIPDTRSKKIFNKYFHLHCKSEYFKKNITKLCECGCGEKILELRWDGKPNHFKVGHYARTGHFTAEKNPRWNNGKRISNGYIQIRMENHPFGSKDGYVFEHRLIWEKHHNAILLKWACIHHINHNRQDNRIENLQPMMKRQHDKLESYTRVRNSGRFT